MAEFNFMKNRDSFLGRMLIKAITRLPEDHKRAYFDHIKQLGHTDVHDIVFSVDGFELPLEAVFEALEQSLDEMIRQDAVRLLYEKLSVKMTDVDDIIDQFAEIASEVYDQLRWQLVNKLGIEPPPEDD